MSGPLPALSVIVPSVNGLGDLVGCLDALAALDPPVSLEVLVVDRVGGRTREEARARGPWVRVLPVAPDMPIPAMRHLGFCEARAPVVAVIEDHVIVPPAWGDRILAAMAAGAGVVGGPIENAATGRLLDWATFLCEYSACMPPLPAGPAAWLPGNNVAYRASLLARHRAVTAEGRWENRLHEALRAEGVTLLCLPDLRVGHKKHYGFGEYAGQRFLYSRSFAAARAHGSGPLRRFLLGAAALGLPPILFWRIARALAQKGVPARLRRRALPFVAVFVVPWAVGEVVGAWFGPGDALARVR